MKKLFTRLAVYASVLGIALGAAPALLSDASDKNACGKQHDEIVAAVKSWHNKKCKKGEKRPACLVPEQAAAYRELKQHCKQARVARTNEANVLQTKLSQSVGDAMSQVSLLGATMKQDTDALDRIVNQQQMILASGHRYGVQLERELLLTSIESDRMEMALFLHSVLTDTPMKQLLEETHRYHGANDRMMVRVMKFVRQLPSEAERIDAYRQLAELLQNHRQDERAPAIIFSQDVKMVRDQYSPDPSQYEGKVVARWKAQLLTGNFSEVAVFAQDHPDYYARVEPQLLGALQNQWSLDGLEKMIHLPNALQNAGQRARVYRSLLETMIQHQNEQMNDAYLMWLAYEMAAFAHGLDGDATDAEQTLNDAMKLFDKFSYNRNINTYAELFRFF